MRKPRLVIAAPASGTGKTTVATGLMAALAGRGFTVSPHKVGPDYIDPGYHTLATGRPGRNLDAFLCGPELMAPLFVHGARGTDVAVVEGVMGLFDGARGHGELASTAHVAKLLDAPVVLVVDAARQARSVAALVHGFATYDPGVRLGGVICNRVGSPRHEEMLREALDPLGVPVLGALPRSEDAVTPSRHLGLVPAAERAGEASRTVEALGGLIDRHCDLPGLAELARTAPALTGPAWDPVDAAAGRPTHERAGRGPKTVAVAGGPAFTFGYRENVELLEAAGAEVVTVDPLRDEALPEGTGALVVGGGFPEVHAAELAANTPLRADVTRFARGGGAVAAECAGLLYLARSLDGQPMCGVLGADARMTDRLTLGYRQATSAAGSVLAPAGYAVRGHEFHRTSITPAHGEDAAWWLDEGGREGYVYHRVHASYLHLHWAGTPGVARRLVESS